LKLHLFSFKIGDNLFVQQAMQLKRSQNSCGRFIRLSQNVNL
jgi:hypothetical protein